VRYTEWVHWLRSGGGNSPLLRSVARTLLGTEKERVDRGELYQSVRRVRLADGSMITVGFLNGQPYAHIESSPELAAENEGELCEIYMQSGVVDAAAGSTLYPPSDATCATIVTGLATDAYLRVVTDGAGNATITGRCEAATAFAGFTDTVVNGTTYTAAQKRAAQKRAPASCFSGLLSVYVQALYGSKDAAYRLTADNTGLEIPVGDGTHLRLRWAPGTLTSSDANGLVNLAGDYYFVAYGAGSAVYYRRMTTTACYVPLHILLKRYVPSTPADQAAMDRFESFFLSAGRPAATAAAVALSGATIETLTSPYGTTYGAQFSRRAATATYVYHGRRVTATFAPDSVSCVENENVTDLLALEDTPFFPRLHFVSADGTTVNNVNTKPAPPTIDEDALPTSVDAPIWAYYSADGTLQVLRYSCELALSDDSLGFAALDVACVSQTYYSDAPWATSVNSCGDTVFRNTSTSGQSADVLLGYDFCNTTVRTQSGPLSRVFNWSAGFYNAADSNVAAMTPAYVHRNVVADGSCVHELQAFQTGYPGLYAEVSGIPALQSFSGEHDNGDSLEASSSDQTIINSSETSGSCDYCGETTTPWPVHPALVSCKVVVESLDYFSGYPNVYVMQSYANIDAPAADVCFLPTGAASAYVVGKLRTKYGLLGGGKINSPSFFQPTWPRLGTTTAPVPIFSSPVTDYVSLRVKYHFECLVVGPLTSYSTPTFVNTDVSPKPGGSYAIGPASNGRYDCTLTLGFAGAAVGSGYATVGAAAPAGISDAIPPASGFTYTDYVAASGAPNYHTQEHMLNNADPFDSDVLFDAPSAPYLVQSLRGDTLARSDFLRPSGAYSAAAAYPSLTSPSFVGWA